MEYLGSPLKIGRMTVNNRIVLPPMATAGSSDDGKVTEQLIRYYLEKADGGATGLIITEHAFVSQEGKASDRQLSIADDSAIEGLKALTEAVHVEGSKIAAQINHAGGNTRRELTGLDPMGPSMQTDFPKIQPEREMTGEDIDKVVCDFAESAKRAVRAGFDAVEIHSAHGYLLNQFYSPLSNKRSDAYGGPIENRVRLHLRVIQAVREAVGEIPVLLRLGSIDTVPGGSTIKDAVDASVLFEKAGIDLLDISGGLTGFIRTDVQGAYFADVTREIKKHVRIPILLTGGISSGREAEALLREGAADLIGVGRAMLRDSKWSEKALAEKE